MNTTLDCGDLSPLSTKRLVASPQRTRKVLQQEIHRGRTTVWSSIGWRALGTISHLGEAQEPGPRDPRRHVGQLVQEVPRGLPQQEAAR